MTMKVRKAVIPAAGYGTRFLPATKATPKEMLPVVDKPIIQYVVEGAVAAGIEEIIFVTSSNKRALEDHFDYNFELEEKLKRAGKEGMYQLIRSVSDMARFVYVRQKEARGTGHAVMAAKDLIGDEPFMVLYGDEFLTANPASSTQLVDLFNQVQAPVVNVIETDAPEDTSKYGYVKATDENGQCRISQVIEKPGPDLAPSNLACVGGYVLTPDIFEYIANLPEDRPEVYLSEAFNNLAQEKPAFACVLKEATYYDSGSKFGFIKANIDLGLKHPETKDALLAYLKSLRDA